MTDSQMTDSQVTGESLQSSAADAPSVGVTPTGAQGAVADNEPMAPGRRPQTAQRMAVLAAASLAMRGPAPRQDQGWAPPPRPAEPPRPIIRPEPPTLFQRIRQQVQPRLLPILIFIAVLMLGVRLREIWTSLGTGVASRTVLAQSPGVVPSPGVAPPAQAPTTQEGVTPGQARVGTSGSPPSGVRDGSLPPVAREALPAPVERFGDLEQEVLQKLAERRAEINRRQSELDQRAALLTAAEYRIDQKLTELKDLRMQVSALVRQVEQQQLQQIESLVKLYETMRPADAARIMQALDLGVLLEVVPRMKESKAAPVLAAMDPARAREITTQLAERRQIPSLPVQ